MDRAFVAGWPLTSSRSPLIHNTWARMYGLDVLYEAVPVPPEKARDFLRDFSRLGYRGGNVTMPHKDLAYAVSDEVGPVAARMAGEGAGSANTLWTENRRVHCESTDGYGFTANLDRNARDWDRNANESTALVLGAGGAALAIVDALFERGFGRIVIANRTRAKAEALAARYATAEALDWAALSGAIPEAALIVNTTALGMASVESDPSWPPDLASASGDAVVNDLVYAPLRTPLLRAAQAKGLRTVDGLGMLLHQAAPGFERWFGVRPEVTAKLRRVVVRDLGETEPVFLGLTGSIGMGKSTTAAMFRDLDVPVYDADAAVHELYRNEAVPLIEAAFPGTTAADGVDRAKLRDRVVGHPERMKQLEGIVHPLARIRSERFRETVRREGHSLAVLDIPLLFETGGDAACEAVVVVTAPPDVQRERVLSRATMSEADFEAVLARQTPDREKRARADFVVDTSQGLAHARSRVRDIVGELSRPDWLPHIRPLSVHSSTERAS